MFRWPPFRRTPSTSTVQWAASPQGHGVQEQPPEVLFGGRAWRQLGDAMLGQGAGYQFANNTTEGWLMAWGKAVGKEEVERILKQQGVEKEPKYAAVLKKL